MKHNTKRVGRRSDSAQIASLVLDHAEGMRVSSALESRITQLGDTEHRFEICNGSERFGVIVTLTKLRMLSVVPTLKEPK